MMATRKAAGLVMVEHAGVPSIAAAGRMLEVSMAGVLSEFIRGLMAYTQLVGAQRSAAWFDRAMKEIGDAMDGKVSGRARPFDEGISRPRMQVVKARRVKGKGARRGLSPEGRARIIAAQKKRWAKKSARKK